MFVLDSHCDTPSQILRHRDLSLDNANAHVDFPKLRRGKVDGAFFALYVPASLDSDPDRAYSHAMELYQGVEMTVRSNSSTVAWATDSRDAYDNKSKGLFSIFLGLENASPIDSIDKLKYFYDKGVRYITLCHSLNNHVCDSCAPDTKRWGGLSPFGKELVAEMNRLGILVDVSHVSDDTFYDVLEVSQKPVVATHSCCRALADHPRNMTDDMIRSLAAAGGVIQINFYPCFLDSEFASIFDDSGVEYKGDRPSYKLIADHIDHVAELVGVDHVGIGSDYDGIEVAPDGMEDISMMPKLFDELRGRGYTDRDLEKIAGGNFFRVLGQ